MEVNDMFEKNTPNPAPATAGTSAASSAAEKPVKNKADELQKENKELIETLQRVQAEFENYQKRSVKEKEQSIQYGKMTAFKDILDFMDSFDAALEHVKDEHRKGLEGLRSQLTKILERNGIKPIPSVGKPFNPETQECLMQGNDPMQADDLVLEEFQKGYLFGNAVLRTAKVKVNTHARAENESEENKSNNQSQNNPNQIKTNQNQTNASSQETQKGGKHI